MCGYVDIKTGRGGGIEVSKKLKLKIETYTANMIIKVESMSLKVSVIIIQFGVNSNKATTGHTLQGVSLNRIVVRFWSYTFPNWVYVALSRVRTFEGLFICEK